MTVPRVLLLPGWSDGVPDPWPREWVSMPGMRCVDQHEWQRPLRGDWLIRLEEAVLDAAQVVLVAHNLGCIQLAAWAAHSQQTHRIRAALIVAPLDVEAPTVREQLPSWSPIERQRLPFKSWMIGPVSQGDNTHAIAKTNVAWDTEWAQALAKTWDAQWLEPWEAPQASAKHISEQRSDWPLGQALLHELMKA